MFTEKPPILRGSTQEQVSALRDYLFRLAGSLNEVQAADTKLETRADGSKVYVKGGTEKEIREAVQKNAAELKSLIIKTADQVTEYVDSKTEEYNGLYVAKSDFGTFTETLDSRIETSARGVVESYGYQSSIESLQDGIDLLQTYINTIDGEIRRGIVLDPETNTYVLGIAISQNMQFSGECGAGDPNNPGDGYTYYYINGGQTFGLYTSTGWQFWINGYKRGWFNSLDGMLHVTNIVVEKQLQVGDTWQIQVTDGGDTFEIVYVGG